MDLDKKKPTIWKYARRKFVETEKSVVRPCQHLINSEPHEHCSVLRSIVVGK